MLEELRRAIRRLPARVRWRLAIHRRLARIEKLLAAAEGRDEEVKRRSEKGGKG